MKTISIFKKKAMATFGKELTIEDYERDNEIDASENTQDENSISDIEYSEKIIELNRRNVMNQKQ